MPFETTTEPATTEGLFRRAGETEGVLVLAGRVRFTRLAEEELAALEEARARRARRRGRPIPEGARPVGAVDLPAGVGAIEVVVGLAGADDAPRVVVERFTVEPEPGRSLSSRMVTSCRPGWWIAEAVRRLSRPVATDPETGGPDLEWHMGGRAKHRRPGSAVPVDDLSFAQRAIVEPKRHRWTVEKLERVAEVWTEARASGVSTGKAVASAMGCSHAAARKAIEKARADGLIPPPRSI